MRASTALRKRKWSPPTPALTREIRRSDLAMWGRSFMPHAFLSSPKPLLAQAIVFCQPRVHGRSSLAPFLCPDFQGRRAVVLAILRFKDAFHKEDRRIGAESTKNGQGTGG